MCNESFHFYRTGETIHFSYHGEAIFFNPTKEWNTLLHFEYFSTFNGLHKKNSGLHLSFKNKVNHLK